MNLNAKTVKNINLPETLMKKFIGGSGLSAKIIFDATGEHIDPLGLDNPLVFMTGPYTGTAVPSSGRHSVAAVSPLTGIWGEADAGGYWGIKLKAAGFDGMVIRGCCGHPVYLFISDRGVEIRDASHLWGCDTFETDVKIKKETTPGVSVASIGPAGEKQVLMASIMHEGRHARAAGRGGLGAVMGSKMLKAVAVCGSGEVPVADKERLMESIRAAAGQIRKKNKVLGRHGTAANLVEIEALGDIPIKNWQLGEWEFTPRLTGEVQTESMLTGRFSCGKCFVGCGREISISSGPYAGVSGAGPEYESICCLGTNCLVGDLKAVAKANDLCNRYGLDTISAGSAVAFAMEAYEKGLITPQDTGGIPLKWGDAGALIKLIEQIGKQQGLGKLLGKGVMRAAGEIGGDAENFALHVKGMELPAHDPRAFYSVAVGYATSNRGACHMQAYSHGMEKSITLPELGYTQPLERFAVDGKGKMVARMQNLMALFDALKTCKFLLGGGIGANNLLEWFNFITGLNCTLEEFLRCGERMYNLKRLFNVRFGVSRESDTLPIRILKEPRGSGGAAPNLPPLQPMLEEYYSYRGWDKNGIPARKTLIKLGLEEEAELVCGRPHI